MFNKIKNFFNRVGKAIDNKCNEIYCKAQTAVANAKAEFSDEQKEIFKKFHDCWSEYMSLGEAAIFEYAFKLGARIMLSVASEREEQ